MPEDSRQREDVVVMLELVGRRVGRHHFRRSLRLDGNGLQPNRAAGRRRSRLLIGSALDLERTGWRPSGILRQSRLRGRDQERAGAYRHKNDFIPEHLDKSSLSSCHLMGWDFADKLKRAISPIRTESAADSPISQKP
jgi:hypothetical protein